MDTYAKQLNALSTIEKIQLLEDESDNEGENDSGLEGKKLLVTMWEELKTQKTKFKLLVTGQITFCHIKQFVKIFTKDSADFDSIANLNKESCIDEIQTCPLHSNKNLLNKIQKIQESISTAESYRLQNKRDLVC